MAASVARAGPSSGAMYDIKCPSEDDHAAALAVAQLETSGKLQLLRLLQSISGRRRVKQFGDCQCNGVSIISQCPLLKETCGCLNT